MAKALDAQLAALHAAHALQGSTVGSIQDAEAPAAHDFVVEIATHKAGEPAFLAAWRSLVNSSDSPQKIYQTPEFFRALQDAGGARVEVLSLVRLSDAAVVGVVPVRIMPLALHFNIGPLRLLSPKVEVVNLLGSTPAVAPGMVVNEYLATQMLALFSGAHAVSMQALPFESGHWTDIEEFNGQRSLAACRIGPWRACHKMPLPGTFDAYLDKFSSKKRYNLKRQLRQLADQAGALQLVRIAHAGQVAELLAAMALLTTPSERPALLCGGLCASLARQGLLLCYVLRGDTGPMAVIIGTCSPEVLHIHNIFVDKKRLALSVGTSAMHLAIGDIISLGRFTTIDFGYGTPNYDFRSSQVTQTRAPLLLFDRMSSISLLFFSHTVFVGTVETMISAFKWARKKLRAVRRSLFD